MQAFVKIFIGTVILITFISSCRQSNTPDVSHVDADIKVRAFYQDMFDGTYNNIEERADGLKVDYGAYMEAYCQRIINIGSTNDPLYAERLQSFIEYINQQGIYEACRLKYGNLNAIVGDVEEAFRFYKYYFPQVQIPQLYLHISGFNQSIAMDSSWISVSLDKYLGADYETYDLLGIPQYLRKRMQAAKIAPDIMKAIAMTSYPAEMNNNDVISSMVLQGKVLYFVHRMVPDIKEHLLFDLSEDELKWCQKYEADIWATMVERKDLFNTDYMVIQKYTGDTPFTSFFGQDSPGRAAVYLGYQIIDAYMKNNSKENLQALMLEQDGHKLFQESRYRP